MTGGCDQVYCGKGGTPGCNPWVAAQGRAPVLALPLPEVDCARLAVHADSQVCHAGAESRAQPEELWHGLEAPLLSGASTPWFGQGFFLQNPNTAAWGGSTHCCPD